MNTKQEKRTIRHLVAKEGLDGHDWRAHVIARASRDTGAGINSLFSGLRNLDDGT